MHKKEQNKGKTKLKDYLMEVPPLRGGDTIPYSFNVFLSLFCYFFVPGCGQCRRYGFRWIVLCKCGFTVVRFN
jgi:hypothetical protein